MYSNDVCSKEKRATLELVTTGLMIALVFLFTKFINIRLPISVNGGLIHLGNVPLFIAAIAFGPRMGALAGGIGMAIFDLTSGWTLWAPFTLVVRAGMGYIIGTIAQRRCGESFGLNVAAILAGTMAMLVGYYFTEVILYGNWFVPFTSIPGNVLQILTASLIALPILPRINKAVKNNLM